MSDTFTQIGSDGTLETYRDTFSGVTPELVTEAMNVEGEIRRTLGQMEVSYLSLGKILDHFESRKLYLALGYETFRMWADSPEIHIGYRLAHDLLRIIREALPILVANGQMELLPKVSTMRDMLPILGDENATQKFLEAAFKVKDLTNREAKDVIKEIRGLIIGENDTNRPIFRAIVNRGEAMHRVDITFGDGIEYYSVGTLHIKKEHWPVWEDRFGTMFTEIVL